MHFQSVNFKKLLPSEIISKERRVVVKEWIGYWVLLGTADQ